MKLLRFPIIQFIIYLIIGVLIAHHFYVPIKVSLVLISTATIGLLVIYLSNLAQKQYIFTANTILVFIFLGITIYNLNDEKRWPNHYTRAILSTDGTSTIAFKISERLKPTAYNDKYEVELLQIDGQSTQGKVLLNIEKDSSFVIAIDNVYSCYSELNTIRPPRNPNQFNYKSYLENQHIYKQLFLSPRDLIPIKSNTTSFHGLADKLRTRIQNNLSKSQIQPNELAIINALILGQRQDIDKATYENYANAGVIHILAVSGLHIGIIMFILQFLLTPLTYLKHGIYIRLLVIVFLLWAFAIIAGLSPSVTRAVTMFTVVAIALNLKRKSNIYNTLAISAFIILFIEPMNLFHVGFQLSYLAVIAIVSFQPILYKIIPKPKFYLTNKLWEIFTVTLAAQIGVLPLSLYYFHQFPGLFFISNLVIIPFLGVILGFGLLVIVMAYFNTLPEIVITGFGYIIASLNDFIKWIANQEEFLFKDIPFGIFQVITAYILIISCYKLLQKFQFRTLAFTLIAVLLFQSSFLYYNQVSSLKRLIVFNSNRQSLIGIQNNSNLHLYHNLLGDISKDYTISNYSVGNRIHSATSDSIPSVISFNEEYLLILDSLGVYNVKSLKPDYVVLRNSPKVNLDRLIDSIKPKQIIADASNYKSYVQRWKATCLKENIPFHSTYEKGAFILD